MVSKAAVIAIIGILAVPILLGYALNVEQVTETEYAASGESVNVTPLLQKGIGYTYVNANAYQLNSEFRINLSVPILPDFNSYTSSNQTSMKMIYYYVNWGMVGSQILDGVSAYYLSPLYDKNVGSINFEVYADNTLLRTVNTFQTVYYDKSTNTVSYTYWNGNTILNGYVTNSGITHIAFSYTGSLSSPKTTVGVVYEDQASNRGNIDISAGYYFSVPVDWWAVKISEYSRNAILTIDLDSITDDNYSMMIGAGGHSNSGTSTKPYYLTKTTTAGVVSWTLTSYADSSKTWDLYYDPDIPHNTYQIYWDWNYDHSGDPYYDPGTGYNWAERYYNSHREFRYVGNWPSIIGESNVYWQVSDDEEMHYPMPIDVPPEYGSPDMSYNFDRFYLDYVSSDSNIIRSPTVRVDSASYRGLEYPLIENKEYDPASFKTNPATTINDPVLYGSSFTFGGNTYNVNKGNIRLESHDIPVKGLVLSSVPRPNGGYDNKIGNTIISSSLYPSTITFNGQWSASISTVAQEETEITKTEWKAGSFAWDGIDHNFIMAGLLASLGAFVGVGIYARRTKSSVWPLLIVCGGAALLFFVML